MVTFEIGSGIKKTSWCSAEIICGGDCPQFTDSGAGVTIYHLYNVSGCNYISESSLVINIKHKDNTEWEHWVTYTMGDYQKLFEGVRGESSFRVKKLESLNVLKFFNLPTFKLLNLQTLKR